MKINKILLLLFLLAIVQKLPGKDGLSNQLIFFKPYIGKTFKGKMINSKIHKNLYELRSWDIALNGMAIRMIYSVNDNEYAGEAFILWDEKTESLNSWHFNTSQTVVNKTVDLLNESIVFIEDVSNNKNGITKVKTIYNFIYNGKLQSRTRFLMDNIWVDGAEIIYEEIFTNMNSNK